jgi:hypothetical protein
MSLINVTGTFETCPDVRSSVAVRGIPDADGAVRSRLTRNGHCVAASEADCLPFLARRPIVKC